MNGSRSAVNINWNVFKREQQTILPARLLVFTFLFSQFWHTIFLGDRQRVTLFFSSFSVALANFQDKHAEIRSVGAKIIATYPKKVQGSLTLQIGKVFNIPFHVLTSTFNFSIGSCLMVSCSDAILIFSL